MPKSKPKPAPKEILRATMVDPPKRHADSHPMQHVRWDGKGVIRFRENAIVRWMLDEGQRTGAFDMNLLARDHAFSVEDWEQFAQLIGYSVSGAASLAYVSDRTLFKAERAADKLREKDPKP
jgi:hypothetical protein